MMDAVEILRKAVTKAKKSGYFISINIDAMLFGSKELVWNSDMIRSKDYISGSFSYFSIIYNISFAEAIWGKDSTMHLQNMVILRNPLEYLEKFVGGAETKIEPKIQPEGIKVS